MAEIKRVETVAEGRFLELQNITFVNDDGKECKWEACQRKNHVNSVSIFAIKPDSRTIVLIKEFRAPVGKYCIGCPAGLIENGESVEEAVKRELLEETGYTVKEILKEGFAGENSAGLTGELTTPCFVAIDEDIPRKNQELDATEHIDVIEVPMDKLYNYLKRKNDEGFVISSKLIAFAVGLRIAL